MTIESLSLAVKYRPNNLDEYIGNSDLKTVIKGFISQKRFPSAFMITGATGNGKTSLARILARQLSCSSNSICGVCESCKSTIEKHPDIKEINVGDERGIDNIRSLKDLSSHNPMVGQQRVIILDEVHALTGPAASALLKILEEPPKKTLFILCTTDPQKVLNTITGRCKVLTVTPPSLKELSQYLYKIGCAEGVTITKEHGSLFKRIYEVSDGHIRNAVQMFESVISSLRTGEPIALESIVNQEYEIDLTVVEILNGIASHSSTAVILGCNKHDTRQLLYRVKFLVDVMINRDAGAKQWLPALKSVQKLDLKTLLRIELECAKIEQQLNIGVSDKIFRNILTTIAVG